MGLRHRSIRFRVGFLIAVPVLSLIALYFFAATFTLGGAIRQAHGRALREDLQPVTNFQAQLDRERHLAILCLKQPMQVLWASAYRQEQAATGRALAAMQAALKSPQVVGNASAQEKEAIARLRMDTTKLSIIRGQVLADMKTVSATSVLNAYDSIIGAGFQVINAALEEQTNVPLVTQALDLVNLARVGELSAEETDLLAGDIAAGSFPSADRLTFAELASQRQELAASTLTDLQPSYRSVVAASMTPAISSAMTKLENHVILTTWGSQVPAGVVTAESRFGAYTRAVQTAASRGGNKLTADAQHQADTVFAELLVAGCLGLIGILASLAISLLLGRNLVRQLRDLRSSALKLAHEKLPDVMRRLRDGEQVDSTEYELPAEPTSNEIEQVKQSFSVVQSAAIQSAVDEAKLRHGISQVFRNLAGRSLSLVQRQLALLDGMERQATEPAELESLFRLDHLTTRMRRHAEGLIILSGSAPARSRRHPVQLIDVLRAATAEVEDYPRIRVIARTTAALAGHAVADVIHLIAELAENATVFSPPNTQVRIQGDLVDDGFTIEIEDRGLGISAARLAQINANLADPPQFDPAGSDRLGLFIAGQLAKRRDIKVTLRPSVFGGTTAIVVIPAALVVEEGTDAARVLPPGRAEALTGAPLVPTATTAGKSDRNGLAGAEHQTDPAPAVVTSLGHEHQAREGTADVAKAGLPVRVRQANLAPQLRDSESGQRVIMSAPGPIVEPQSTASPADSAEAAGNTISALQRGWQVGRASADEQASDGASDESASRAAPALDVDSGGTDNAK